MLIADAAGIPVIVTLAGIPAGVATQLAKLNPATTLVGRSRTMSSPGTALRLPNSSARSGPI